MTWLDAYAQRFVIAIAIITSIISLLAYYIRKRTIRQRAADLEQLLATRNKHGDNSLTADQLAIDRGYTVEQVIEAAQQSKKIVPWPGQLGNERRYRLKR